MSVFAKKWAYEQQTGQAGAKAVLVALAEFADETGFCFPSQHTLAAMTEIAERTVRGHLAYLEEKGFIRREERRGQHGQRTSDGCVLLAPPEALKPSPDKRQILPVAKSASGEIRRDKRQNPPVAKSAGLEPSEDKDEPSIEPSEIDISARVESVFRDYCETVKRVARTEKRLSLIKVRLLEGRSETDLHSVWLGALRDPWPERKLHNDIVSLLESPERVERMIELSTIELPTRNGNGTAQKHTRTGQGSNRAEGSPDAVVRGRAAYDPFAGKPVI